MATQRVSDGPHNIQASKALDEFDFHRISFHRPSRGSRYQADNGGRPIARECFC
jgi:hypothetical protein